LILFGDKIRSQTKPFLYLFQLVAAKDPVHEALLVNAGEDVHINPGQKIVLEASAEIAINVGGSFIKVTPSGITLGGPDFKMKKNGHPGVGAGWAGQMPGLPGGIEMPPHWHIDPILWGPSIATLIEANTPMMSACQKRSDGSCPRGDCPCGNHKEQV